MKKPLLVAALWALVLAPALASSAPPALDPHHSCLVSQGQELPGGGGLVVPGTFSYLAPVGTSLSCPTGGFGTVTAEFGSQAGPCVVGTVLQAIVFGPVTGAFCNTTSGFIVPAGGTATCSWTPWINTVPTGLVIGFDGGNGFVRLVPDGEIPVYGPFPPGAWRVSNPLPTAAFVIAFPTDLRPYPTGAAGAPSDVNLVACDTP